MRQERRGQGATRWADAPFWLLGLALVAAGAYPLLHRYLVTWPQDQWQVDLEVYREAGRSILYGRPIYDMLTEPPQLLPFTYPPFAALLALPLAFVSFHTAAWIWDVGQLLATYATVWIAARRLLGRTGRWAPVVCGAICGLLVWIEPVSDGLRFGQVNAFIVLACLIDLAAVRARWPRGLLIGLAAAVKLTPGVFLLYFAWVRRWHEARGLVLGVVAATALAAFALPEATLAYFGQALEDPNRLGPNNGTSNQSIRGLLLRTGLSGPGLSLIWIVLVLAVLWLGFRVARAAYERGDRVAEVGAVGLLATLVSPVAWIHHLAWLVVVICALVGDGRQVRRWIYAAVITGFFLMRLPFWGVRVMYSHTAFAWTGRLMQNADTFGALLALGLLALALRAPSPVADRAAGSDSSDGSDGQADAERLEPGEYGEEQAHPATDPADGGQPDVPEQEPAGYGAEG